MAQIKLKFRMGFPALFEPDRFDEKGKLMYSVKGIILPGSAEEKLLDATVQEVAKAKWGAKAPAILKAIADDKQKMFFMKKDYCNESGDPYDGFEGNYYLTAKNEVQPLIIDKDRTELQKKDGRPYSGCWIVAKIDVYAQDNSFGKGMRASLLGVQFLRDGDAFAGGAKAKVDDFDDLSDTGEDADADDDLA